jgi:sortase A
MAAERLAWIAGALALAVWTAAAADRAAQPPPDQRLWSPERVQAWQETQKQTAPIPLAVLRIPRLGLEVAVLEGTDDWTLNRAVGHIAETAAPGADRDGFFRALKDIGRGDEIQLETPRGREVYRVKRTWIVDPEDVSVLDPTPVRSLTLVTCFPFYYIGSAPQRFIVRAARVTHGQTHSKKGDS